MFLHGLKLILVLLSAQRSAKLFLLLSIYVQLIMSCLYTGLQVHVVLGHAFFTAKVHLGWILLSDRFTGGTTKVIGLKGEFRSKQLK